MHQKVKIITSSTIAPLKNINIRLLRRSLYHQYLLYGVINAQAGLVKQKRKQRALVQFFFPDFPFAEISWPTCALMTSGGSIRIYQKISNFLLVFTNSTPQIFSKSSIYLFGAC